MSSYQQLIDDLIADVHELEFQCGINGNSSEKADHARKDAIESRAALVAYIDTITLPSDRNALHDEVIELREFVQIAKDAANAVNDATSPEVAVAHWMQRAAYDAAVVAAAEVLTDATRAFFDSGKSRDGRLSENLDAAHKVLFFSVMAKRAAQETP